MAPAVLILVKLLLDLFELFFFQSNELFTAGALDNLDSQSLVLGKVAETLLNLSQFDEALDAATAELVATVAYFHEDFVFLQAVRASLQDKVGLGIKATLDGRGDIRVFVPNAARQLVLLRLR